MEEELELFPPMKLLNLSGYAIRCWGYRGSIISHPNLANPTSSCIHPSTHNQEKLRKPSTSTFEKHPLYKLWQYSRTPAPVLGASRWSHQQLHKRDFRCRRTKLRYSRTATIKLWRQHLGAQLPGTLPQPLNDRRHQERCSCHKSIGTIPRYPRHPNFFSEIWEAKSQNSTSGCLTRAMRGPGSKKNS